MKDDCGRVVASLFTSMTGGATMFLLALLLLLVPPVNAGPSGDIDVQGHLTVGGHAVLSGLLDGHVDATGFVIEATKNPSSSNLTAVLGEARVLVVNFPTMYIQLDAGGIPLTRIGPLEMEPEVLEEFSFKGSITQLTPATNLTQYVLPSSRDDALPWRPDPGTVLRASPPTSMSEPFVPHERFPNLDEAGRYWTPTRPSGLITQDPGTHLTTQGDCLLLLFGGEYLLRDHAGQDRVIWTGTRSNQTMTHTVDDVGGAWYRDRIALVVMATDADVELTAPLDARTRVALRGITGTLTGDLELRRAEGSLYVDGDEVPGPFGLVQAIGTLAINSRYDTQDTTSWSLQGEAVFVGVDGATFAGERPSSSSTGLIAVGAGLTLLGLLALLTNAGREALAVLHLRVADPLSNTNRLRVLRVISIHPGTTSSHIQQELGLPRATVRHHLRILWQNHFITDQKEGKIHFYFLNTPSVSLPASSSSPRQADSGVTNALPIAGHPVRRLLLETLRITGPASYQDMLQHWEASGVSSCPKPGNVSHHAAKMLEAGLLTRSREGRNVYWSIAIDPVQAIEHRIQPLLSMYGAVEVLQQIPARAQVGPEFLAGQLPGVPHRRIRRALRLLFALGILDLDPQTSQYELAAVPHSFTQKSTPGRAQESPPIKQHQ